MIRTLDIVLGIALIIIGLAAFTCIGIIVDGIEILSFVKGAVFSLVCMGSGFALYKLGTMED